MRLSAEIKYSLRGGNDFLRPMTCGNDREGLNCLAKILFIIMGGIYLKEPLISFGNSCLERFFFLTFLLFVQTGMPACFCLVATFVLFEK